VSDAAESGVPFRWDLQRPDQLGTLLDAAPAPSLSFLDDLVRCAALVVARSDDGDLVFVGRSLDSMFDLLGAALAGTPAGVGLRRLPLSRVSWWAEEPGATRDVLASLGLTPYELMRRRRPVVLVDVVYTGSTFVSLLGVVRDWVADERAQWDVVRLKLRFVGVTMRERPSPGTERWWQNPAWTRELPRRSVVSVSLDGFVWSYFGDVQPKLTPPFLPGQRGSGRPRHDERTRRALAEAVALVEYGRSAEGRRALTRAMAGEPALAKPWLRSLIHQLNHRPAA
jgi:hypothetical protein